ncbi:hypothetical protein Pryu01_01333 [Paraliobacillus ryukyuensis]|uniref:Uncharacterized protein n=1 Tax=Paraliobacillus ryukyuensis TaxID=200904 RepID=A0A366EBL0_9BACI|nr:hypothetical protein DES48_104107 [Paraliobacillus ryukyuensis]
MKLALKNTIIISILITISMIIISIFGYIKVKEYCIKELNRKLTSNLTR